MERSKEELIIRYKTLSTNELLDMYLSRSQFTQVAVEVMKDEIHSRGLNQEDLESFLRHKVLQKDEFFKRENFKGLMFLEKLIYYHLFFIILVFLLFFSWLADASRKEGYKLKIEQAILYVFSSLVIFFLSLWLFSEIGIYVWVGCFLIPFYFDFKAAKKRKQLYKEIYDKPQVR